MGNLTFIGNRAAGMTTYVGALAYYSKVSTNNRKNRIEIIPINDEAERMQNQFDSLILQGLLFEPTEIKPVLDISSCAFRLDFYRNSKCLETLNLLIRDYSGSWFETLVSKPDKYTEYLEELAMPDRTGILILLDRLTKDWDISYSKIIKNLIDFLFSYLDGRKIRIAIVLNKCDRGEIWTRRKHPEDDIFSLYFPKTRRVLRDSFLSEHCQFFAISIFGVLDKHRDPRPNKIDDIGGYNCSVLRAPDFWQPYNIISPIYWLCTGKNFNYPY